MRILQEETDLSSSLPLLSLNHVSYVCKSVEESAKFYQQVLGFVLIKRPYPFKFEGAWLFNYGIGIHLLQSNSINDVQQKSPVINPKDNHISFQCTDIELVKRKLEEMAINYATALVEERGVQVDQLFFHDPDGYMIEICNCDNLPILHLSACPLKKQMPDTLASAKSVNKMETQMMENFVADMIDIAM